MFQFLVAWMTVAFGAYLLTANRGVSWKLKSECDHPVATMAVIELFTIGILSAFGSRLMHFHHGLLVFVLVFALINLLIEQLRRVQRNYIFGNAYPYSDKNYSPLAAFLVSLVFFISPIAWASLEAGIGGYFETGLYAVGLCSLLAGALSVSSRAKNDSTFKFPKSLWIYVLLSVTTIAVLENRSTRRDWFIAVPSAAALLGVVLLLGSSSLPARRSISTAPTA